MLLLVSWLAASRRLSSGRQFATKEEYPNAVVEELLREAEEEEFNWDKHLGRLAIDDENERDRRRAEEDEALGEWEPENEEDVDLMLSVGGDDAFALVSEPSIFKQRWDDVDPESSNFRNVPDSVGATWSRIRNRADWWQFDARNRLKDGHRRFDFREFDVPDCAFEARPEFEFGYIDPVVAAKIMPALKVLDATVALLEAHDGYIRVKYQGWARHRHGIECYAKGLIKDTYEDFKELEFETLQVVDPWDGTDPFTTTSDLGRPAPDILG